MNVLINHNMNREIENLKKEIKFLKNSIDNIYKIIEQ